MIIHFENVQTVTNSARKAAEIIIRKDEEQDTVAKMIMDNIRPDKTLQTRSHYETPLNQLIQERHQIATKILAARLEANAPADRTAEAIIKETVKQYQARNLNEKIGYITKGPRKGRIVKFNSPKIEYDYDKYQDNLEEETLEPEENKGSCPQM